MWLGSGCYVKYLTIGKQINEFALELVRLSVKDCMRLKTCHKNFDDIYRACMKLVILHDLLLVKNIVFSLISVVNINI